MDLLLFVLSFFVDKTSEVYVYVRKGWCVWLVNFPWFRDSIGNKGIEKNRKPVFFSVLFIISRFPERRVNIEVCSIPEINFYLKPGAVYALSSIFEEPKTLNSVIYPGIQTKLGIRLGLCTVCEIVFLTHFSHHLFILKASGNCSEILTLLK